MCFKSKVKTPKTDPDSLKAPEPVLIDEPKGVAFGAEDTGSEDDNTGVESVTVKKDSKPTGDGSTSAVSTDTGMSAKKTTSSSPVKRALKKATQ